MARLLTEEELKQFIWAKVEALLKEQVQRAYSMGYNAAMKEMEQEKANELRRV
jgi:hypothetical protein